MRNKLTLLLLAAAILLTGCQLARPEKEGGTYEDTMVGLYVVHYDSMEEADEFYDNPHLTEYGSVAMDTQFGEVSFPDTILVGELDRKSHACVFPGMTEGWSLFALTVTEENGETYNTVICDMDSNGSHFITTDEGEKVELEGTIYMGPPADAAPNWDAYADNGFWRYYRVYQMADGTVYLNGSGDSSSGGGGWGYSLDGTSTTTINGETTSKTVKASVNVEVVPRLEKLIVTQFDRANGVLKTEELPLTGERQELECLPGTAWVLVEEHSADGVERAAYSLPEEGGDPVCHTYVVLDGDGMGKTLVLAIL